MLHAQSARLAGLALLSLTALAVTQAEPQAPAKIQPKLEAIAETKLLMEGLAQANFRGLERLLKERPSDLQSWKFARGQALLLAETANLLMLRPPRGSGQAQWFDRTMEMRLAAQQLAKSAASQDFEKSRSSMVSLAATCNRCHRSFAVAVDITAFEDGAK
jgi:hypothetical protein